MLHRDCRRFETGILVRFGAGHVWPWIGKGIERQFRLCAAVKYVEGIDGPPGGIFVLLSKPRVSEAAILLTRQRTVQIHPILLEGHPDQRPARGIHLAQPWFLSHVGR